MSLLPTRIWLYISFFLSSAEPNDRHAAPYRLGQHARTGDHRAKSGVRRLLRKRWPLPKARLRVILDQAIMGKSGAEGDLLDSVRQTLDERSPAKCPVIPGPKRQIGQNDYRTGK